jgi:hypothetical protein
MVNADIKLIYNPLSRCYSLFDGDNEILCVHNLEDALEVFIGLCNEVNDRR